MTIDKDALFKMLDENELFKVAISSARSETEREEIVTMAREFVTVFFNAIEPSVRNVVSSSI